MPFWKKKEQRAESYEDPLINVLLGSGAVTRQMALQVPTVSGGIDLIANIISGTPIKLYQDVKGARAKEITGDYRLRLLNDETGDTLNANQFWRAMVRDYYLGKGGYAEDMEPLGLDWIRLGLQDVLYNPKTHELFTPNTGTRQHMDGTAAEPAEDPLPEGVEDAILEQRGQYYKRDSKGRFMGGGGKKKKTKYAPSPQKNHSPVRVSAKKYAQLSGIFKTKYPDATSSDGLLPISDGTYLYRAKAADNGGITIHKRYKLK